MTADQLDNRAPFDQPTVNFDEPRRTIDPELASAIDRRFAEDIRISADAVSRRAGVYNERDALLIAEGPRAIREFPVFDSSGSASEPAGEVSA